MPKSNAPTKAVAKAKPKAVSADGASNATSVAKGTLAVKKNDKNPKLKDIFVGAGFVHIESDNIHFELSGRKGEIDHIFVWENVVLLCEETAVKDVAAHCTKKIYFHKLIADDWPGFFEVYRQLNPAIDEYIKDQYNPSELEVRHIYYSEEYEVEKGVATTPYPFKIVTRAHASYFLSLVNTIAKSAKYEILKYLNVSLSDVGQSRLTGAGVTAHSFAGFALPPTHTNYPAGFAVVSFYADPMALIQRAYVLRRDGWEVADLSYQRFVRSDKLASMRTYLSNNGKVFINNLIVTLPSQSLMRNEAGKIVDVKSLAQKTYVNLQLPLELGTVGIVDGQHRILAYFEGVGAQDQSIAKLRKRQNLLVTGIIFPEDYTQEMRVKFEAELFLAINSTQSTVDTQLRQDLETIINPDTPLALGRSIINRLALEGPLEGMLHVSQFDSTEKIATGSLGPSVLKPLMRKGGALYRAWDPGLAADLSDAAKRKEYLDFAASELRTLLAGCRATLQSKWKPVPLGGVLSTTVVGGLILLLARLAEAKKMPSAIDCATALKPISAFDFSGYKSSGWAQLSKDLYKALNLVK